MIFKTLIPKFLKPVFRFIYYVDERKKAFRELSIRKSQNIAIKNFDLKANKLIVFIVPGADRATGNEKISGGIISIVSICEKSSKLFHIHEAETIMCTHTHDCLLLKHNNFDNETRVFRLEQIINSFENIENILIHLPEYMTESFSSTITKKEKKWLESKRIHYNILNQSIALMPSKEVIKEMRKNSVAVTITTAHQKYCSAYFREFFNVPLHKFSTWVSPEQYYFKDWRDKENILIVSPDEHAMKDLILSKLKEIPDLTIQIIENITYEKFKKLIARAKWSITFGEGLDGYLVEPIFSGAIGFAVFNEDFFTSDFAGLSTIYPSMEVLREKIVKDISRLDNKNDYACYQKAQFDLCAKYYSQEEYKRNISAFYRKEYTYA